MLLSALRKEAKRAGAYPCDGITQICLDARHNARKLLGTNPLVLALPAVLG